MDGLRAVKAADNGIKQSNSYKGIRYMGIRDDCLCELFSGTAPFVLQLITRLQEMIADDVPYPRIKNDTAVVMEISRGRLPERPNNMDGSPSLRALWRLHRDCCRVNPKRRPTSETIVRRLSAGYYTRSSSSGNSFLERLFRRGSYKAPGASAF